MDAEVVDGELVSESEQRSLGERVRELLPKP
jgi:hypothetical protein